MRKVYVSLNMEVSAINTNQNGILFGFPSPFTYIGFITNLLLKEDLTNNFSDIETVIGIKDFYYISDKSTTSRRKANQVKSKILFKKKAMLNTNIVFSFESLEEDIDIIKEKLEIQILSNRFSGGFIKKFNVKVYAKEDKQKAERNLFGSFFMIVEDIDFKKFRELKDFLKYLYNKILKKGAKNELTILGYNFLNKYEDIHIENPNFKLVDKEVFGEAIYGLVSFRAVSNLFIKEGLPYFKLSQNKNNIYIIQKKGE
jgi:hypothetical protein